MPSKRGTKISGENILSLVYNKHNVADMKDKHRSYIARLKAAGIKGLPDIDDSIHACTMHSFCDYWRRMYTVQLDLVGYTLIEEAQAQAMMFRAINLAKRLLDIKDYSGLTSQKVLSFYNLCMESFKEPKDLLDSDKFRDLECPLELVEKCFERYEAAKRLKHKYDYCDILTKFCKLLESDPDVRKNVQEYYDYVIVDEVQDFTPVMWRILKCFVDDGTPMTCIGDEDQLIYYFRGASMNDLLHFSDNFSGGKVYTLTQNRRCRKAILDEAIFAIDTNDLRFNKNLVGTKDGGSVELIPYNSINGQLIHVVETLKNMPPDERSNSVICFREQACSQLLTELLVENGIEYASLQNSLPYSYELYRHVMDVLNALEMPYEREVYINLYKALPCKKSDLFAVFGFDPNTHRFSSEDEHKHFTAYDYNKLMNVSGFSSTINRLIEISRMIPDRPMNEYIPEIFKFVHKYFWDFKCSQKPSKISADYDELFEKRVFKYFNTGETFKQFYLKHSKTLGLCRKGNELKGGVTISTFHGLKGLEFKHVFVIFMDDDIFPNFSLIRSRGYTKEVTQEVEESETRLWYVAITRAIDDLKIYYSKTNPSCYVQRIIRRNEGYLVPDQLSGPVQQNDKSLETLNILTDSDVDDPSVEFTDDDFEMGIFEDLAESQIVAEPSAIKNTDTRSEEMLKNTEYTATDNSVNNDNNLDDTLIVGFTPAQKTDSTSDEQITESKVQSESAMDDLSISSHGKTDYLKNLLASL